MAGFFYAFDFICINISPNIVLILALSIELRL